MMQFLPTNIYSVESVRAMDRSAIDDHGIPGYTLMQRAAEAAFRAARQTFPDAKRWQVVCGAGNNGGDGYVLARLAAGEGIAVSLVSIVDPEKLTGDAATAYRDCVSAGGIVNRWTGNLDRSADLIVDAILGSGLQRAVSGDCGDAVAAVNLHSAPVQAMDIATGINGDTGEVMGIAVVADLTTTFVGLKAGLFLGAGPDHSGTLTFDDLGISTACRAGVSPCFRRVGHEQVAAALPRRARDAHKGDFGHVLVVGGGPGMPGAARLCGEAALRSGAGRVTVATYPDHAAEITAARPELMSYGIGDKSDNRDNRGLTPIKRALDNRGLTPIKRALTPLLPLLDSADVVAFGPGLGQSAWALSLYEQVVRSDKPAVWDADALNVLSKSPKSAENRIITPHPGEAASLLGVSAADVQADRPAALRALADKYGGIAILKGAGTLVSATSGQPFLCTAGNPGMAAPGMGDVLTGVIAGLIAQGLSLQDAATVGVDVHARAGDRAAGAGERGMLAGDLVDALRAVVNP